MKEILTKLGLSLIAASSAIILSIVTCWLINADFNDNSLIIGMITGFASSEAVRAYENKTGEEQ